MGLRTTLVVFSLAAGLSACGGQSTRAAWPDVASTDRSAADLGLPAEEVSSSEVGAGAESGGGTDLSEGMESGVGTESGTGG